MIYQDRPIEVPNPRPEIKPSQPVPGPAIQPEHPPTLVPEEKPNEDNPKPPQVEPVPPEIPKKLVA